VAVWAIADLHLAFGVPEKSMEVFGEPWIHYTDKLKEHWMQRVQPEDLVLIAGDISWAKHLPEAKPDLEWIHALPGTKVLLRGNHDFWWTSLKQIEAILPPSMHLIQNNAFHWKNISVGGARLWDSPEYQFNEYIHYVENPRAKKLTEETDRSEEAEKIFQRELGRLEISLKEMARRKESTLRIVMTHYPPISAKLDNSRVSALLEKYQVNICVFGHLHNVKKEPLIFGEKNQIRYYLTSADYLDFKPLEVVV
jgi:predicted phosphohydrolase